MEMEKIVERAIVRFKEGYSCSESVLLGYTEAQKINAPIVPRIATGFRGGIGRCGSVCGALVGAIMGIGLKYGRDSLDDPNSSICTVKAAECYKMFEKEFGQTQCRSLINCDLSDADDRKRYEELNLRETNCARYVEGAARILAELIRDYSPSKLKAKNL
ncbi:MAG: C-GCAxxG-C-C family protein [Nitrososphaeria archaeon]